MLDPQDIKRLEALKEATVRPELTVTHYTYAVKDYPSVTISVELTKHETESQCSQWAVRKVGACLNQQGEWEYEPSPSNRDESFLARCRFARDTALQMARKQFLLLLDRETEYYKKFSEV